jgi:hypothetical protein
LEAKTSKKLKLQTHNSRTKFHEQDKPERSSATLKERREGRMKDALALGGEEGRDKLR